MKRLYLVRHAKSDWSYAGLADFDRPLNKRGRRDAKRMGKYLKRAWKVEPDYLLCSTAKRVRSTVKRLRKSLNFSKKQIAWHDRIYSGHSGDVLDLIRQVDNQYREVMVIGHNPDMTVLVNEIAGSAIVNVPTCGVAGIDLPIDDWSDAVSGDLVFFEVPKSI